MPNQWLYNQWLGLPDEGSMRVHAELVCACLRSKSCSQTLSGHSLLTDDWRQAAPASRFTFERVVAQSVAYFA